MKIEIVGQPRTEVEPVLKVRLEYDGEGGVDVVLVDENGVSEFYLFGITPRGTLTRYRNLSRKFGLELDGEDRIVVEDS